VDQERAAGKKILQESGEIGNERVPFDLSVSYETRKDGLQIQASFWRAGMQVNVRRKRCANVGVKNELSF
jgi:hypothetical protein